MAVKSAFGWVIAAILTLTGGVTLNGSLYVNQKLSYLVPCGDPDAIDSIVPMAYGNLALHLLLSKIHGRLVVLRNGRYDSMPIDTLTAAKGC
jgi:6-phosphofructokinase